MVFGPRVKKLWIFNVFMSYKNYKNYFIYILVVAMAQGTLVNIEEIAVYSFSKMILKNHYTD